MHMKTSEAFTNVSTLQPYVEKYPHLRSISCKTHLCTYVFKEKRNLFNLVLKPSLNEQEKIQFEA